MLNKSDKSDIHNITYRQNLEMDLETIVLHLNSLVLKLQFAHFSGILSLFVHLSLTELGPFYTWRTFTSVKANNN